MLLALLTLLAGAPDRVLVLELDAVGADPDTAAAVGRVVTAAAGEVDNLDVISSTEVKKLVELETQKQMAGCDDSSCLAELAGALGARAVLFGSVAKLGSTTTVTLSLFDSADGSVTRAFLDSRDLSALPTELRPRVRELLARVGGSSAGAPASAGPAPLFVGGAVSLGAGAIAAIVGGVITTLAELQVQTADLPGPQKTEAQSLGRIGLGVGLAGLVAAAVGGGFMAAAPTGGE